MASTRKPVAVTTSELPAALAKLKEMKRTRFHRLSARLPPQPGNVPHIEWPRGELVEYMRLARRVYAHPNYHLAMLEPIDKDERSDNSLLGKASRKT
ncbi:BQ2448_6039 [Microbotryum intermedium]|uniref:BQ2448_6039 protein n=1 Tax=Microbotryum intermedium TaxID=269621 RepID=A0A238FLF7_9BASI|nr:BQ2448_6039 [Microbotryum intermedium]